MNSRLSLFYTAAIVLLFVLVKSTAMAQTSTEEHEARVALAHSMANMTISILTDQKKKTMSERQEVLVNGFAKSIDIDWIAKFVIGSAWKNASDEQRAQYTDLYRQYLTHVYVSTYAESPDRKIRDIKVVGINDSDTSDDRFTTRTAILLGNGDSIKVDYLAEARGPGRYKIIDVVIEGVSLLSTHRAEFAQIAAKGGIESVIAKLEAAMAPSKSFMLSMK